MNLKNTSLILKGYGKQFYRRSMLHKGFQSTLLTLSGLTLLILALVLITNFFSLSIAALSILLILDKIFGIRVLPHEL